MDTSMKMKMREDSLPDCGLRPTLAGVVLSLKVPKSFTLTSLPPINASFLIRWTKLVKIDSTSFLWQPVSATINSIKSFFPINYKKLHFMES